MLLGYESVRSSSTEKKNSNDNYNNNSWIKTNKNFNTPDVTLVEMKKI